MGVCVLAWASARCLCLGCLRMRLRDVGCCYDERVIVCFAVMAHHLCVLCLTCLPSARCRHRHNESYRLLCGYCALSCVLRACVDVCMYRWASARRRRHGERDIVCSARR